MVAVQVPACGLIPCVGQTLHQRMDRCVTFCFAGVESGERKEDVTFERQPFLSGKCHIDAEVCRPLGDQRLRTEQRDRRSIPIHPRFRTSSFSSRLLYT